MEACQVKTVTRSVLIVGRVLTLMGFVALGETVDVEETLQGIWRRPLSAIYLICGACHHAK